MARPKKDNADYFSHDRDMRNDNKIKAVRRKYKAEGYAIWNMMLEHLTDCDFFEYKYTDLNIELLSGDFDVEPERLKEIIEYFILLELLVVENGTIKSLKLINRFESLLNKRKRDVKLKTPELSPAKTPQKPNKIVFDDENPQSKVKENKVKESKVEVEDSDENWKFKNKLIDIDKLQIDYLENVRVIEAVLKNPKNKFENFSHLKKRVIEFTKTQKESGVLSKTMSDYSSHFRYWHIKQSGKSDDVTKIKNTIPIG